MKKHLLLLCILLGLVGTRVSAYDFTATNEGNTIYYNIISDEEVEVTYNYFNEEEWTYYSYYKGNVVIPSTVLYNGKTYNVTRIGNNAFDGNYETTSIYLPASITTIGEGAICNVYALTNINIPYGVTSIEKLAFYGCDKITSFNIPTSVKSIGERAFSSCKGLTDITIPEGVGSLEYGTFGNCINLKTVTLPKSLTTIGYLPFSGCTNLTSITIEATTSPKLLGSNLGYDVPKSCILNYPKGSYESYTSWSEFITVPLKDFSVDGIYYNVLSKENLTAEVTFQGDKYNSYPDEYIGDVVIPQTVTYADQTFTVTAIGESAFSGCENVTSIKLPSTIKEIKEYGINYCTKLTSINLPEGLTIIGPRALRICSSLTSIEIPTSVTTIGEDAFYDCSSLSSITFKGAVNTLESQIFSSCENLKEIHVDNITDWCKMGFTEPSSNPLYVNPIYNSFGGWIGSQGTLYINGQKLSNLIIPDNVEKINDYAFYCCEEITSIDFGKGVKTIGNQAFSVCLGLTSLTIPANVTLIENDAFGGNNANMAKLIIEDSTEPLKLGYCPYTDYSGYGLFAGCRITEPIYIGRDLIYEDTQVGGFSPLNLAYGNSVPSVTFGKYVTKVGNNLLGGTFSSIWGSMKNIYFNSNPALGTNALYTGATIHLNLSDEGATNFNANNTNTYDDITYERELPTGKYGTIILPFAPDAESLGNFIFYELTSVDGISLVFDEVENPQANTPYLYTLREGKETTQITGGRTTINDNINNPETVNNMQMIGSFTNQTIEPENEANNFFYAYTADDNKLHRVMKELTVKPYRAYFTTPSLVTSGARSFNIYVRSPDGIKYISTENIDNFDQLMYDLSGRPISNPIKGNIYIKNGKKEIFR